MASQFPSTNSSLKKLTINDLPLLCNTLNPVASKCFAIGLQLGVEYPQIRAIEQNYRNCEDQLREIISERLKQDSPLTWRDIVTALRSPTLGENSLASEIEQEYLMQPPTSLAPQVGMEFSVPPTFPLLISDQSVLGVRGPSGGEWFYSPALMSGPLGRGSHRRIQMTGQIPVMGALHQENCQSPPQLMDQTLVRQPPHDYQPLIQMIGQKLVRVSPCDYPSPTQTMGQTPVRRPSRGENYQPHMQLMGQKPVWESSNCMNSHPHTQMVGETPVRGAPHGENYQPHTQMISQTSVREPPHGENYQPPIQMMSQTLVRGPPHGGNYQPPTQMIGQTSMRGPPDGEPPTQMMDQIPAPHGEDYQPPPKMMGHTSVRGPPHGENYQPPPQTMGQTPVRGPPHGENYQLPIQMMGQTLVRGPPHGENYQPPTQMISQTSVRGPPHGDPPTKMMCETPVRGPPHCENYQPIALMRRPVDIRPPDRVAEGYLPHHMTPHQAVCPNTLSTTQPYPTTHTQGSSATAYYRSQMDTFVHYVKNTYKIEKNLKWPPTPSNVFINLACIDWESVVSKEEADEYTRAMVEDGNVDVIMKKKTNINFSDIVRDLPPVAASKKVILVEGAPGVGKSTFAWEVCRRWDRGEIAQQYQLVLLLRLRDERMSRAKSLRDLIYHPSEDTCHQSLLLLSQQYPSQPPRPGNQFLYLFPQWEPFLPPPPSPRKSYLQSKLNPEIPSMDSCNASHSRTDLKSSSSTSHATVSTPLEYNTKHTPYIDVVKQHSDVLTETINGDLTFFINKFIELGFVTRTATANTLSHHGVGNGEKAGQLLSLLTAHYNRTRNKKKWFNKFVGVFSSDPAYEDLEDRMRVALEKMRWSDFGSSVTEPLPQLGKSPLFRSPMDAFVQIGYKQCENEGNLDVLKWPPTPSKVFINLACIDWESVVSKEEADEYTRAMVEDGKVDVIMKKKTNIDLSDIVRDLPPVAASKKVILVEGAPGVGKSTFAWEFCRRWYRGEIAQQYQLVLLLRLRDERMSIAKSLRDLIYHPSEDTCHQSLLLLSQQYPSQPPRPGNQFLYLFPQWEPFLPPPPSPRKSYLQSKLNPEIPSMDSCNASHSRTDLKSSSSTSHATVSTPLEYNTKHTPYIDVVNQHSDILTETINGDLTFFINKFIELGFVTRTATANTLSHHGVGKAGQLLSLLTAHYNRTRNKKKWFNKFVGVFSSDPAYEDLEDRMRVALEKMRWSDFGSSVTEPLPQLGKSPLFRSPMDAFVQIGYKQCENEGNLDVLKWPPTPSKVFINLACIDWESVVSKEEADEYTRAMVEDGKVDVIMKKKTDIDIDDIVRDLPATPLEKIVLVEGAPGVGKSTFAWEFCRRWERGEIAQLVLLLRLRDERMSRAKNLRDLIYHPSEDTCRLFAVELVDCLGTNTLMILEGFDELPNSQRREPFIFLQLILGQLLPILVTSRPWATGALLSKIKHKLYVEILGFTEENITRYVTSVFTGEGKKTASAIDQSVGGPDEMSEEAQKNIDDVMVHIGKYPQMKACMYIPLNAAIVVSIYRESMKNKWVLPTTLTELYNSLAQILLLRHLSGHSEYAHQKWSIESFEHLPGEVYSKLLIISKTAHNGVCRQRGISVQLIFPDIPETLGLMQSVSQLLMCEQKTSHNFLHLTFQEFLAAFLMSTMSPAEQLEHFQRHKDGRLKVVLRFLAGLTKLKKVTPDELRSLLGEPTVEQSDEHQTSYCNPMRPNVCVSTHHTNWLFEAQNSELLQSLFHNHTASFTFTRGMLPLEYYSVGYCIAHTQSKWSLTFDEDTEEEKVSMLLKGAYTGDLQQCRIIAVRTIKSMSSEYLNLLLTSVSGCVVMTPLSLPHLSLSLGGKSGVGEFSLPILESLIVIRTGQNSVNRNTKKFLCKLLSSSSSIVHFHFQNLESDQSIVQCLCNNTDLELKSLEIESDCTFTATATRSVVQFTTKSGTLQYLKYIDKNEDVDIFAKGDKIALPLKSLDIDCKCTVLHIVCKERTTNVLQFLYVFTSTSVINPTLVNHESLALFEVVDSDGNTLLHTACAKGNLRLLVRNGANVLKLDKCENAPIHIPCKHFRLDTLKELVALNSCSPNQQNADGNAALHIACKMRNDNEQQILEVLTCFNPTLVNHERMPSFDIVDSDGNTLLHIAYAEGSTRMAKLMVMNGAHILKRNRYGDAPIHIACKLGRLDIFKLLLNSSNCNPNQQDARGDTACECYYSHSANLILSSPPLFLQLIDISKSKAVVREELGRLDILKLLLNSSNCNPNQQDARGDTACECYYSHAANLMLSSPPLFLQLIDISKSKAVVREELAYWWSITDWDVVTTVHPTGHHERITSLGFRCFEDRIVSEIYSQFLEIAYKGICRRMLILSVQSFEDLPGEPTVEQSDEKALAEVLHISIPKELNLSSNSIGVSGAVALAQALHRNQLDLSGIYTEDTYWLVESLTESLTANTFITFSHAGGLTLPRKCDEYATQCTKYTVKDRKVQALHYNSTPKQLDLSGSDTIAELSKYV